MFVNQNSLNEGSLDVGHGETRKRELYEGKNPKSTVQYSNVSCWQGAKECAHVNSNWQKLRK